jgi:N utilization substance protein B
VQRLETRARARALQLLYAWDALDHPPIDGVAARLAPLFGPRRGALARAADLAARVAAQRPVLDARIAAAATHWRMGRLGAVERNILRLALVELDAGTAPPRVVIDEAVRLAQWFAGAKAPAFVNGVLDALAREAGVL